MKDLDLFDELLFINQSGNIQEALKGGTQEKIPLIFTPHFRVEIPDKIRHNWQAPTSKYRTLHYREITDENRA